MGSDPFRSQHLTISRETVLRVIEMMGKVGSVSSGYWLAFYDVCDELCDLIREPRVARPVDRKR